MDIISLVIVTLVIVIFVTVFIAIRYVKMKNIKKQSQHMYDEQSTLTRSAPDEQNQTPRQIKQDCSDTASFCKKCGTPIQNETFCTECGYKVE